MVLVVGVMMVRNEADVVRANVLHHHRQGIRQLLIVDDGSTDGTPELLEELEREGLVRWFHHSGIFLQAAWTNRLMQQARLDGADWVVPLDADEFWIAPGSRIDAVLAITGEDALQVKAVNLVQRRSQLTPDVRGLTTMLYRPTAHFTSIHHTQAMMAQNTLSHVEVMGVPKWIHRPHPQRRLDTGSHTLTGPVATRRVTADIICMHAALRSRDALARKMGDFAERLHTAGIAVGDGAWHVQRWARLLAAHGDAAIDIEWAANSVDADGALDVYGTRRLLHRDLQFHNAMHDIVQQVAATREAARDGVPT